MARYEVMAKRIEYKAFATALLTSNAHEAQAVDKAMRARLQMVQEILVAPVANSAIDPEPPTLVCNPGVPRHWRLMVDACSPAQIVGHLRELHLACFALILRQCTVGLGVEPVGPLCVLVHATLKVPPNVRGGIHCQAACFIVQALG